MQTIRLAHLKGACSDQRALFHKTFPDGAPVSIESAAKARAAGLSVEWLEGLLPAAALAEYDRATAPAWAEYDHATAAVQAEYDRATAAVQAEYYRAKAAAWAAYDRARDAALVAVLHTIEE